MVTLLKEYKNDEAAKDFSAIVATFKVNVMNDA